MKQEEKNFLLSDICARLPYGIIIYRISDNSTHKFIYSDISENIDQFSHFLEYSGIDNIKPYLRPISSMTEDEEKEFENLLEGIVDGIERWDKPDLCEEYDWLNAHHFDYRGLIEKGLAIAVTKDNNPYKE